MKTRPVARRSAGQAPGRRRRGRRDGPGRVGRAAQRPARTAAADLRPAEATTATEDEDYPPPDDEPPDDDFPPEPEPLPDDVVPDDPEMPEDDDPEGWAKDVEVLLAERAAVR